jgi:UDP-hydrolysing UDP-N-acetyl-D-glucosamine 2-epimerase
MSSIAKRKICVVITARPSYARIRSALEALRERNDVELQIVLVASTLLERYGRIEQVIERDGFSIDWRVSSILEGENLLSAAKSTGIGLMETATALANLKPDVVVTIADRFETIATAIAATYQNIPLAHIQGGEVSGNIDDRVRHAITKLADLHLVASEGAAARVISMGENPQRVILTGCPSIDISQAAQSGPRLGDDVFARFGGVGQTFDLSGQFIVVMQHPVTTEHDEAFAQATETLHAVRDLKIPTLWFWPNVDAGSDATSKAIRMFRERHPLRTVHFFRNMPPEDFNRLLFDAAAIVGNSSAAIRECAYLGTPAINIGSRQSGRERGPNVLDVAYDRAAIGEALQVQLSHGRYPSSTIYGDGTAGPRIAKELATGPLSLKTPGR